MAAFILHSLSALPLTDAVHIPVVITFSAGEFAGCMLTVMFIHQNFLMAEARPQEDIDVDINTDMLTLTFHYFSRFCYLTCSFIISYKINFVRCHVFICKVDPNKTVFVHDYC